MKFVAQRVNNASLRVDGELVSEIGRGLVVYVGVKKGDTCYAARKCAEKIARLRIFPDEAGKLNRSVTDIGGEVLLVSNFTLYGDASHSNRPGFTEAEAAEDAKAIYSYLFVHLGWEGVQCKKGVFGADMRVSQENDGPVTIIYECNG